MSRFLTPLDMRVMWDADGNDLLSRDGRQLYQLLSEFVYQSDVYKKYVADTPGNWTEDDRAGIIRCAKGFVTDLGSVPRIPLIYDELGDITQEPYVIHDKCYSCKLFARRICDEILAEALAVRDIPWWKIQFIYAGVRVGGGTHWDDQENTDQIEPLFVPPVGMS